MLRVNSIQVLAVAILATGCVTTEVVFEEPVMTGVATSGYGNGGDVLTQGRIRGEVGRFSADTDQIWGFGQVTREQSWFDVRGMGSGVVMGRVDIFGLDVAGMEPGDVVERTGPNESVTMITCAGPENDAWEEDVYTEQVEVTVIDVTPEEVTLEFTGRFPDLRGRTVTGQAVVPVLNW